MREITPQELKLLQEIHSLEERVKELELELTKTLIKEKESALIKMGVGEGSGDLYVYGNSNSIQHLRKKLFELERLRVENFTLRYGGSL